MSLPVGFNLLSDRDTDAPPMSAVLTCSKDDSWDHGAWQLGYDESFHLGAVWIDRPYFTGAPSPEWLAQKVKHNHKAGALTQLGNEWNHPVEKFQGAPADGFALHDAVLARLTPDEREGVIAMPPSPGFPNWQRWVNRTAKKHAVHCYGDRQVMQATVQWFLDNTTADLFLTEINPGAGNRFDLDVWARDHLRPFLAWCEAQPRVQVVLYFAWKWDESKNLPSSVDAAGTAVATTLRQWVARKEQSSAGSTGNPLSRPDGEARPGAAEGIRPPQESPEPDAGGRGAEERGVDAAVPAEVALTRGVDVSNWQQAIDWPAVASAGYRFAFAKGSEDGPGLDDYYDPWFARNWRESKAAGLIRGVYHFAQPDKSSPAESVTVLQTALANAGGLESGDLLALDIEAGSGDLLTWVAEWCALAEQVFGVTPILYTGHWFTAAHNLEDHAASLGKCPLWLASYQSVPPPCPPGWERYAIWQFTAHGSVPGINGDADLDVFEGSEDDLRALGKRAEVVEPAPEESPHNDPAVVSALDVLWAAAGADVEKQKAIVGVKVAFGLQEAA